MAHDARLGLATMPSAAGNTPSYLDAQQWVKSGLAVRRWLADRLGGEGIYHGGAAAIADFVGAGTRFPAVQLVVGDDAGEAWYFTTASATAITFSASNGQGVLYAVARQMAAVSPAAATGGATEVSFVAQLDGEPAPSHSLRLGTGTITASAFTTWTEEAGVRKRAFRVGDGTDGNLALLFDNGTTNPPGLRWNTGANVVEISHNGTTWTSLDTAHFVVSLSSTSTDGELPVMGSSDGKCIRASGMPLSSLVAASRCVLPGTGLAGGGDLSADRALEVTYGTSAGTACQGNDSRLSNARLPTAHQSTHATGGGDVLTPADIGAPALATDNTMAGVLVLSNGKLRIVRDATVKYGCPSTGTYGLGDRYWDRAGAPWCCTAAGTPGTWVQLAAGVAPTLNWSGATADNLTNAANWATGSILDGYRVHEPGVADWTFVASFGASGRWVGSAREQTAAPSRAMPANWTVIALVDPFYVAVLDAAFDHYLTGASLSYFTAAGTFVPGSLEWNVAFYPAGASPAATINIAAAATSGTVATASASTLTSSAQVFVKAVPTGSPPSLSPWGAGVAFRPVRK